MSNLKEFDLEKALAGEKVVTKNGMDVFHVTFFETAHSEYNICACVNGILYTFNKYGHAKTTYGVSNIEDIYLFMAPTKKKGWIALFKHEIIKEISVGNFIYETKELAMSNNRLAINFVEIEWEE